MSKLLDGMREHTSNVIAARDAGAVVGWVDTGNYALNWTVGGRFLRGYPLGHVVELFGPPGSGKTYLALRAIAEVQRAGGEALMDDTECALNTAWAEEALGVDPDHVVYVKPPSVTVEDHYKVITAFAKTIGPGFDQGPYVFVLDSVGGLTTEHEQEVGLDKPDLFKAKLLHAMFRLVGADLSARPVVYIVTNHIYTGPSKFGNATKSSGGTALDYKAGIRLRLSPTKDLKSQGEVTGVYIRIKCVKNRFTSASKEVEMIIPFTRPISRYSGLIPALLNLEIIEEMGRFVKYQDKSTGIYTNKSDPLKQEVSAEALIKKYPELLTEADAILTERGIGGGGVVETEELEK